MQAEKLEWSVVQNDDRITLRLSGELSRHTLLALRQAFQQRQQGFAFLAGKVTRNMSWDLAQLSRIDSAGFAVLCEILSDCRRQLDTEQQLRLENVPHQLLTLADLFNLDDWLNAFIHH